MGRIDPAPQRPGRGLGSPADWVVAGVLAIALAALLAFEMRKQSRAGVAPAIREAGATAPVSAAPAPPPAPTSAPESAAVDRVSPQPPEPRFEHAQMEVTIPRPSPSPGLMAAAAAINPAPTKAPEGLHERMTRCLSFRMDDDEDNATTMPQFTQALVTVKNLCDFSFVGSEVWFEARVSPARGEGTAARVTERLRSPIPARGSTDVKL